MFLLTFIYYDDKSKYRYSLIHIKAKRKVSIVDIYSRADVVYTIYFFCNRDFWLSRRKTEVHPKVIKIIITAEYYLWFTFWPVTMVTTRFLCTNTTSYSNHNITTALIRTSASLIPYYYCKLSDTMYIYVYHSTKTHRFWWQFCRFTNNSTSPTDHNYYYYIFYTKHLWGFHGKISETQFTLNCMLKIYDFVWLKLMILYIPTNTSKRTSCLRYIYDKLNRSGEEI